MASKELKLLGQTLKALVENDLQEDLKKIIFEMAEEEPKSDK